MCLREKWHNGNKGGTRAVIISLDCQTIRKTSNGESAIRTVRIRCIWQCDLGSHKCIDIIAVNYKRHYIITDEGTIEQNLPH